MGDLRPWPKAQARTSKYNQEIDVLYCMVLKAYVIISKDDDVLKECVKINAVTQCIERICYDIISTATHCHNALKGCVRTLIYLMRGLGQSAGVHSPHEQRTPDSPRRSPHRESFSVQSHVVVG